MPPPLKHGPDEGLERSRSDGRWEDLLARRSFWAWGLEDDEPTPRQMAEAAAAVSRLYGVSVEPRPAPTSAELNLRPTRISAPAPGFGSRQTLISLIDPAKISTLVTWDSNEIYDAWRASPERGAAMAGAEELWAKPPESERFDVIG